MPRSFREVFPADGPEWEGEQGELTRTRCGKETSLGKHACLGVNPSSAESPGSPGPGLCSSLYGSGTSGPSAVGTESSSKLGGLPQAGLGAKGVLLA